MKNFVTAVAVLSGVFFGTAARAEVQDCIEITALPAVISQQGVHCFKQDLNTSSLTGTAITINAHNVTIDLNGFKLGGLAAGANTEARGIFAQDRQNITIRNGTIRGFFINIILTSSSVANSALNSGHVVERMRIESGRRSGIDILGTRSTIRDNIIFDIGNGVGVFARGILVAQGGGHVVTGNSISGLVETAAANGIVADATAAPYIRGNQIRDLAATTTLGIRLESDVTRAVVQDNFISNTVAGTTGISGAGDPVACIDNVVTNFTTPFSGCDVDQGNTSF